MKKKKFGSPQPKDHASNSMPNLKVWSRLIISEAGTLEVATQQGHGKKTAASYFYYINHLTLISYFLTFTLLLVKYSFKSALLKIYETGQVMK